jgi:hypothetical protein
VDLRPEQHPPTHGAEVRSEGGGVMTARRRSGGTGLDALAGSISQAVDQLAASQHPREPETIDERASAPLIPDPSRKLTKAQARKLTDTIKGAVSIVWDMIKQAYTERAWSALGYSSWDAYCEAEFGTSRLRLPREERSEVVASLRESGMSIRNTVRESLRDVGQIDPPEPEPIDVEADELAEELIAAEPSPGGVTDRTPGQTERVTEALARARSSESAPVIGLDGKTYRPKPPQPQRDSRPRRGPITDELGKATRELGRITARLSRLAADDRFARNREVLAYNRSDLIRARDALNDVIDQLGGGW